MMHTPKAARRLALIAAIAAAGIFATACSSDSDEDAEATTAPVEATATVAATAETTAAAPAAPTIEIADIRARASAGLENENSAAYAVITNRGTEKDRLVSASVDASVADHVELHTTVKEGEMMRMVQVEGWDLEPGASLELMPGGNHVMILELAKQFVVGDTFTLTLVFEKAGEIEIEVPVMEIETSGMSGAMN
jgi:copper(I)-binding protein